MNDSIWTDIKTKEERSLDKDISCDILIIGGGMAGMHVAYYLKDEKYKTVLIDKSTIGSGITARTTAKITYLQGIYSKIEKICGFAKAKEYLNSQIDACNMLEKIINEYSIDCDYEKSDSYLYETSSGKLEKEMNFLEKAGVLFEEKNLPINFPCVKAIKVEAATFHPLKYLNTLKNILLTSNVKIYENTRAVNITRNNNYYVIRTLNGIIKAKKIIVCTNYPFFVIPGFMPFRLYIERSYVICGKGENKGFNAINMDKDIYSIRYYKDNIIFAGLTESLSTFKNNNLNKLENIYKKYFGDNVTKKYQNQDVMTHDYIPIIGKVSNNSNLLVATGFNKWGMTNGVLSGKVISDIVLGEKNQYEDLFNPERKISIPKLLNGIVQNSKISYNFVYTKLLLPKSSKYYQKTINGVKCYIYEGNVVNKICPHMKCTLTFNDSEKTWDCLCHGSRFTLSGELINGPSVDDIKMD